MLATVPFYVVTFNRERGLREALTFVANSSIPLELIVLDMGSSLSSFICFRDSLGVKVHHFPRGMGPRDLWINGELLKLGKGGFFLSDGDIDYRDVKFDAAEKMIEISERFPWFPKVGLALQIEDLPQDSEGLRVRDWAAGDWAVELEANIYLTGLDTTIAYYPRRENVFFYRPCLRLAGEYQARHYPWYERQESLDEEGRVYRTLAHSRISSSTDAPWPTTTFRIKRIVWIWLLRVFRLGFKKRALGKIMVRIFSIRYTIKV